jgi:hypothetical protein
MGSKKRAKKAKTKIKPVVTFEDVASSFMRTVYAIMLGLKARTGGAHNYGADGLFHVAVESLETARATRNLEDFLKSAAYSTAAAMKASGAWDFPVAEKPKPEEKPEEEKPEEEKAK